MVFLVCLFCFSKNENVEKKRSRHREEVWLVSILLHFMPVKCFLREKISMHLGAGLIQSSFDTEHTKILKLISHRVRHGLHAAYRTKCLLYITGSATGRCCKSLNAAGDAAAIICLVFTLQKHFRS